MIGEQEPDNHMDDDGAIGDDQNTRISIPYQGIFPPACMDI